MNLHRPTLLAGTWLAGALALGAGLAAGGAGAPQPGSLIAFTVGRDD